MESKEDLKTRAQIIMARIKKLAVSDEEIAVKMGVSYSSVVNWKTGRRIPKKHTIEMLSRFFL